MPPDLTSDSVCFRNEEIGRNFAQSFMTN